MTPGTILKDSRKNLLFLVLHPLLDDPKDRVPITILSPTPFEIDNVYTQVYTAEHVYYLVPGAGWLTRSTIQGFGSIDILEDEDQLLAISADRLILTQLDALRDQS